MYYNVALVNIDFILYSIRTKGDCIHILWNVAEIKETFNLRANKLHFSDNTDYFLNKSTKIMNENYIPSKEDTLRVCIKNNEMVSFEYTDKDYEFAIQDWSGCKNQR